jgi:hypothetical protein
MRRAFVSLIVLFSLLLAVSASAASGKVVKVLPHFLDAKGQHTTSPSLYDRDAYQAMLRKNPEKRSGIRYDVQWKARAVTGPVKLRVELRGIAQGNLPRSKTIEAIVDAGRGASRWNGLTLAGEDYKAFGEVTAWRVTLWDGETLLGEQTSFLW